MTIETTKNWYEESYGQNGFAAQRLYPNEELLRFMGRNYFSLPKEKRATTRILEVGCGSCSNLWMIAREGFDAYGLDLSEKSLELGKRMLDQWQTKAQLMAASMTDMPYEANYFDAVVDVFSSFALDIKDFDRFLSNAHKVLRSKGKLFLFTPTTNCSAWTNFEPAKKIDEYTLDGIFRPTSPFSGNHYPFRFSDINWLKKKFDEHGFKANYCDTVTRSYYGMTENFEHVAIEGVKL